MKEDKQPIKQERKEKFDQAKKKAFGLFKYFPNFFLNLLSVGLIALLSAVAFDIDFQNVVTLENVLMSMLLSLIYTIIHWNSHLSRLKKLNSDEENIKMFKTNEEKIREVTNSIKWKEGKGDFITSRNFEEKKKAWIIKVQKKLNALKPNEKDLEIEALKVSKQEVDNLSKEDLEAREREIEALKSKNKYLRTKRRLEEKMTDVWIAKNLPSIEIDYNKIDAQFVEQGLVIEGIIKDKVESRGRYFVETVPSKISMFFVVLFLTILVKGLQGGNFSISAWVDLIIRVTTAVFNYNLGVRYGERFFKEVDVYNSNSRVSISDEFVVTLKNKEVNV